MSSRKKKDALSRRNGGREYRDVCWVSAEGNTEKEYFKMAVFQRERVVVRFPRETHPHRRNPEAVLARLRKGLKNERLRKNDEAWLVVDVDEWRPSELESLLAWERDDPHRHLAISNPKFELFLVMHFEKGNGCVTSSDVDARLKKYLPRYKKHLDLLQFDKDHIIFAIGNAEAKCMPSDGLPVEGSTTVHRLAQKLLNW